jgi:hypothetical protein
MLNRVPVLDARVKNGRRPFSTLSRQQLVIKASHRGLLRMLWNIARSWRQASPSTVKMLPLKMSKISENSCTSLGVVWLVGGEDVPDVFWVSGDEEPLTTS